MNKLEKLDHKKWLIAVSGGSDSMALLEMCRKAHLDICVAHVNYQKRTSANRDMQGVFSYCEKYKIPCFIHKVENYEKGENFQAQARKIRYDYFKKCCKREHLDGVLVAHHQDDVLETYIMQKKRRSIPTFYGIGEDVKIYGVQVKRVLLSYSKLMLEQYCKEHHVPYYEDESNLEECYERNKVRHQIVSKMSEKEKEVMLAEIDEKNRCLKEMRKEIDTYISKCGKQIQLSQFLTCPKEMQKQILRAFIIAHSDCISVSDRSVQSALSSLIHHKKENIKHTINNRYDLCLEYGKLFISTCEKKDSFSFVFEGVEYIKTAYFETCNQGKTIEGITLSPTDFPITIRNAKNDDKIKLRMGTKKVRRFFIDNKISHKQRQIWPVVVNCEGNVIFVSGIGCDIAHFSNNSTMFVLK